MSRLLREVPPDAPTVLDLLPGALTGDGPALHVVGPGRTPRTSGTPAPRDDLALAVGTSGSTGAPRTALLSGTALTASATATATRLRGLAQWLLTLPVEHVAGLQVLVRSVLAGTRPVVAPPGPFTAGAFAAAVARLDDGQRCTSLVPTQLRRVLDDAAATDAARAFDAILLGGAATPTDLLGRARDAGLRVVTTYGMTETCGGCVYDGVPLDGVDVAVADDGRVLLAGAVLADGYLDAPLPTRDVAGRTYLRTGDLGRLDDGVLTVLGRADDVVVTGGVNVAPAAVEDALVALAEIAEACVVGVPDDEWGQAVAAVVVAAPGARPSLEDVRDAVTRRLGAAHAPRRLVVVDALPRRGPGKTDRTAAARLVVPTTLHDLGSRS